MKIRRLLPVFLLTLLLMAGMALGASAVTMTFPSSLKTVQAEAFLNDASIETVILPDGTERLEARCFAYSALKTIRLPESVSYIADDAFEGCKGVVATGKPGSYAAQWCLQNGVEFQGDGTTSPVSDFTFTVLNGTYCTISGYTGTDTALILPGEDGDGHIVQGIADNAFKDHTALTSVVFPDSVEWIGSSAFNGCTGLLSVTAGKALATINGNAFSGCTGLTSVVLPEGLERINYRAFSSCSALQSIHLPDSITVMQDYVFAGCTKLASVNYPISWVTKEYYLNYQSPFAGCTGLKTMNVPEGVTKIPGGAFYGASLESISLPGTLTEIEDIAFEDCAKLKTIDVPESVTTIGGSSFKGCTSLKTVKVPDSVVDLGEYAFQNCTGLTSVYISSNVKTIGKSTFSGCTGLTSVILPEGLERINYRAFSSCSALQSIHLPDSITVMQDYVFDGCTKLASVNYPVSWVTKENYYPLSPFAGCTGLKTMNVPEGVTKLPDHAFYGASLESISLPGTLTEIGSRAFSKCAKLKTIDIPESVTTIGGSSFEGCTSLKTVKVPDSVVDLGGYAAFKDCTGLTSVYISSNVKTIGENTFSGCTGLTSVILPEGLERIDYHAFYSCSALQSIHLPDSITVMQEGVFAGCTKLASVNFPVSWTINADTAYGHQSPFAGCTGLKTMNVPEGVTKIPDRAFYGASLESISLPGTLTEIGSRAFRKCANLIKIQILKNVTSISSNAFDNHNAKLTFYGETGSYAETYAKENSISFSSDSFPETLVTLSGRILDREGGGISDVTVRLYLDRNDQQEPVTVVTDEDGVWRYTAAKAWHDYLITLSKGRYRFGVSQLVCSVKDTDTAVQTLYGSLLETPYVTVGGSVTTKNGVGVSGVTVRIVDPETLETLAWASTADNGEWWIQLTAVNKMRWAVYQAADYQLSADQVNFSADQDSTLPTVTAELMSSGSGEISFTVENDRLYTGEPILFTVVSPKATRARLIVDGVAYNEFPLDDGKAEFTRIFTQGGNREIAFQAYLDGSWGAVSAAQTLSIETEGTLEAPQFQIPAKVVCGTTVALSWDAVAHADQYVIYLYRGGVILSREETTECSFEISGSSLLTEGQYSVEVIATGKRYGQKSYAQLFDVYRPESSLNIETPAASDSFVAGDTFYIKISNPDQLYLSVCVTAPDGSSVFYPQTGISNAAEQLFTYICEFSGKYQIEAFGFATAVNLDWGHPLAAAEPVEITVHASEIASVSVGNRKENQIVSETALEVKAVVNNAVQEVKVYENEVLLATITDFTEADFVRTFTGSIPTLEEGVHTIRFEAADGENHIAKRLFTFYGVTSVSNLPDQYAVQDGVELYRYPDSKTVQGTLSISDKLKIMGSFGDYYYAAVEGVEGYVLKQKVFEYSDETRNKIQLTLVNRVPGEGLEAYIADEHWIDLLWQVENIPENCHMAMELLTQQGSSALWSDSLYKLETLADNQFRYSVLSTALQGGEHYYAACSILTEDGVLVKQSLEDVFIFASWNDWLVSKQQETLDLQFRNSGTVFSNVLVNRSADLMVAAYDKAQCLALMEDGYGFKDLKAYNYTSGEHTVAFVIGHKVVLDADGKSTILYGIALRGTQGMREWISNFTLGTGKNHSGFMFAADDAWTYIKRYMATFPDSQTRQACQENYKVWLTGHSRAAAVGNYLSATYFSNQVRRGDLYGYFFAVPNVAIGAQSANASACIRNFNFSGDIVPRLPLVDWGYSRYGITTRLEAPAMTPWGTWPASREDSMNVAASLAVFVPTREAYAAMEAGARQACRESMEAVSSLKAMTATAIKGIVACALYIKSEEFSDVKALITDSYEVVRGFPRVRTGVNIATLAVHCNWKTSLPSDLVTAHDSELYQYVIHQTYGQ